MSFDNWFHNAVASLKSAEKRAGSVLAGFIHAEEALAPAAAAIAMEFNPAIGGGIVAFNTLLNECEKLAQGGQAPAEFVTAFNDLKAFIATVK